VVYQDVPVKQNEDNMGWIDSGLTERAKLEEERTRIEKAFDGVWDGLWREITKHIEAYREKGGSESVATGGGYEDREVSVPNPGLVVSGIAHGTKRRVTLRQGKDKTSISAEFEVDQKPVKADSLRLDIKVCRFGVVCLMQGDKELTLEQAAILVLDPILFPDLPRTAI
jgi:hypothetical protein